jgi:hypothetical protein
MSAIGLLTPILNGGIQNVNFVNGRVLTAEDMTAERSGNLQRQRLIGTAVGDGVANGLQVTLSASSVAYGQQVVHVTAGLAVNRNGDMLQLPAETDITLTATLPAAAAGSGLFTVCQPPQTQLTNPGIFVLTIMPASGYQGQVPVTQLNSSGVATSCSSRFATAGVQFRLSLVTLNSTGTGLQQTLYALGNEIQTQLNGGATAASLAPSLSLFRNGLAHACFGTDTLATYAANPFAGLPNASSMESYGLIDAQRNGGLMTNCEVPLALAYWSQQGIEFVDMWSVRRPVFPLGASGDWPLFSGRRRSAEGLASLLQFQGQVNDLLQAPAVASALTSVIGSEYFFYLPAAGILPILGAQPSNGFSYAQFFSDQTFRCAKSSAGICGPAFIEGAKLDQLVHSSFLYPPIDLSVHEMIWLYWIRENLEPAVAATSFAQPYLVFANGHIADQSKAQFDLNYWDYAQYA